MGAFDVSYGAAALAGLISRTMQLNVSVVGGVVYIDNGKDSISLEPTQLLG